MLPLLRIALAANVAFSATCALVLTLGARSLDEVLGVAPWLLLSFGIALGGFAVLVAVTAATSWVPGARAVMAADVAWVLIATGVLIGFGDVLTTSGTWALLVVTIVVLDLAVAEGIGLRRTAEVRP